MSGNSEHSHTVSAERVDENVRHKQAIFDELGITAKPHISYEWSGFRHNKAGDTIAAARKAKR